MDVTLVAAAGAFVVICAARLIYGDFVSPEARVKRALARRPRVAIGQAPDGLVRLTGRARTVGEPLRAPVTQRPCVAYQVVIEERLKSYLWERTMELTQACPFLLEDESGTALVDAGPFAVALVPDKIGSTPLFGSEGRDMRTVRDLLNAANVRTGTLFSSKAFRYSEAVVLPGREISVGGRCSREVGVDGAGGSYREPPQRVVVRGSAEQPLLLSNWRQAREE